MAWQTPKTNWQANNALTPTDFNRIEGNIQELQNTKETPAGAQAKVNTHAGSKQTHGISSGYYIAKTSRSDQLPAWNDIQGKPSLVTSSDLSNALAAKVDKPTSATSGNIAVFDGGPGKLKDGGMSIANLTSFYREMGYAEKALTKSSGDTYTDDLIINTGKARDSVMLFIRVPYGVGGRPMENQGAIVFSLKVGGPAFGQTTFYDYDWRPAFYFEEPQTVKYANDVPLGFFSTTYYQLFYGQLLPDGRIRLYASDNMTMRVWWFA